MITQVLRKEYALRFPIIFPLVAICSALGIGCSYLMHYTSNIPYWDDFLWAVNFMSDWSETDSVRQHLDSIYGFYFEHRIVWLRLFLLIQYEWFGAINFKWLLVLGNIGILVLPFLFLKTIPGRNLTTKLSFFWPVTWMLWQPQCYHNLFTTYGLSNHYSILFALLSVYGLIYHPKRWTFTILLAIIASFTTGSGLITWVVGGFILFWQNRRSQLVIWIMAAAICILCYFCIGAGPTSFSPRNVPFTTKLLNLPFYIPTFCFSIFDFGPLKVGKMIAMTIGIVVTGAMGWIIYSNLKPLLKNNPTLRLPSVLWKLRHQLTLNQVFLLHSALFVILTGAAASFNRVGMKFNQWSLPDYYRLYSQIFMIIFYCWWLQYSLYRKQVQKAGFIFSALFWCTSYSIHTPDVVNLHYQIQADAFNFTTNGRWSFYPAHRGEKEYELVNNNTHKIIEKGIWTIPSLTSSLPQEAIICNDCKVNVSFSKTKPVIQFQNTSNSPQPEVRFSGYSDGSTAWLTPLVQNRADLLYFLKHGSLVQPSQTSLTIINRYFFKGTRPDLVELNHRQFKSIPSSGNLTMLRQKAEKIGLVSKPGS